MVAHVQQEAATRIEQLESLARLEPISIKQLLAERAL